MDSRGETELRHENELLRLRVARLERELAAAAGVVREVKDLAFWDFSPYRVSPDASWLAVDRGGAETLLAALARVDHWHPWSTRLEPRPRP
ncbi:hypothetical protein [Amycolatopsis sp. VC5-11]|uniref:hypothetical protein n=1 Tax=Amycolatopsis sp. VC5-11 TaxID=3120156 RepID=UPI00300A17FE